MSGPQEHPAGIVQVDHIKLAMWLKLNGLPVRQRLMLPDGHLVYWFTWSPEFDDLIRRWAEEPEAERLSRFASMVSYEIRKVARKRRSLGLLPQFSPGQVDVPSAVEPGGPEVGEES